MDEAFTLLAREIPKTLPLGGGSSLSHWKSHENIAVVDLQALGMRQVEIEGGRLLLGANNTLQNLIDSPSVPDVLKSALALEGNHNLRQTATIGGTVASAGQGSILLNLLRSSAAMILWQPGNLKVPICDLPSFFNGKHGFISAVDIDLSMFLRFETIRRTPESIPTIAAGGSRDKSGRITLWVCSPESGISTEVFDGEDSRGIPDPAVLSSQWMKNDPSRSPYLESALTELFTRVLIKLNGED